MKTLMFALAVGVAAFLGLRLLAPSPSWEDTGDSLAQFLDGAVRAVIGKGDARGGPIVPAIPTLPAYAGPFQAGQEVAVARTGGCLNVRIYPRLDAPTRGCLPEGTRLRIIQGPLYAQGIWWWAAEGQGWIGEPYLSAVIADGEEPLLAQEVAAGASHSGSPAWSSWAGSLSREEAVVCRNGASGVQDPQKRQPARIPGARATAWK